MNRHLNELIELSQLDKAIDDFNPLIEAAQKKVAKKVAKRDEIAAKITELSGQIEDTAAKITAYENQIRSLNDQLVHNTAKEKAVKNEKEAQALQMEGELAKEKLGHANEEINRLNKVLEARKSVLADTSEQLDKAEEEASKISEEVEAKISSIEDDKAKLFAQRESKTISLDQKILSFYEKIRIWAKNSAVVPVRKQACYGCYMKINDSAYAELIKSEEIITCHHCGRILYIEPQVITSDA